MEFVERYIGQRVLFQVDVLSSGDMSCESHQLVGVLLAGFVLLVLMSGCRCPHLINIVQSVSIMDITAMITSIKCSLHRVRLGLYCKKNIAAELIAMINTIPLIRRGGSRRGKFSHSSVTVAPTGNQIMK